MERKPVTIQNQVALITEKNMQIVLLSVSMRGKRQFINRIEKDNQ